MYIEGSDTNLAIDQSTVADKGCGIYGLWKCRSVVGHGSQALLPQSNTTRVAILARKINCVINEPLISNASIPSDGYNILPSLTPCLQDGLYAQLHERSLEWNETELDWQTAQQTVQVGHAHLVASFNLPDEACEVQGLAIPALYRNFRNSTDMLVQLNRKWTESGDGQAVSGFLQHETEVSDAPDIGFLSERKENVIRKMVIGTAVFLTGVICWSVALRKCCMGLFKCCLRLCKTKP